MTLSELVSKIEELGYVLSGKENIDAGMMESQVATAPMVMILAEPPVQADCRTIPNILTWDAGWSALRGYARLEGAAAIEAARMTVVRLQFVGAA